MHHLHIRTFAPECAEAVVRLQHQYSRLYPDAPVVPSEVYQSPAFEAGKNIFCALDASGALVGYAPVMPSLVSDPASSCPHTFWAEVKVDPTRPDYATIKDRLYERVFARARAILRSLPPRRAQMVFQYYPSETTSIAYALAKGATFTESIFTMSRDLSLPLPEAAELSGLRIISWKMPSEAEQRAYVMARNQCFPEAPVSLADWQYFMLSPQWQAGRLLAAFDGEQLVGSVNTYWDPAGGSNGNTPKVGFTEDVFVLPPWRGQGAARAMLREGLAYLHSHGLKTAELQVRALNEQALGLYFKLGYLVSKESRLYMLPFR